MVRERGQGLENRAFTKSFSGSQCSKGEKKERKEEKSKFFVKFKYKHTF